MHRRKYPQHWCRAQLHVAYVARILQQGVTQYLDLCDAAGGTISSGNSGLGAGGKGAVALAVIIVVAALVAGGFVMYRRRQQKGSPAEQVCLRAEVLSCFIIRACPSASCLHVA